MNSNLFVSALLRFRNFSTLIIWTALVNLLSNSSQVQDMITLKSVSNSLVLTGAYGAGVVVYLAMVIQSMDYNINLSVIQVEDKRDFIFKGTSIIDSIKDNFKKVYPFSYNNVFIIENDDENIEDRIIKCTGVTDLKIRKMVLGKDFKNFANFFDLFR